MGGKKVIVVFQPLSLVQFFCNHMDYIAHQYLLSTRFSRQEYWSVLPFPSPGDLPNPRIEPRSPTLQADTLTSEPPGKGCLDLKSIGLQCLFWSISSKAFTCNAGDASSIPGWRISWYSSWYMYVLYWRRKWQPTPVFLPGESQGQRSLAGYSPWGHKESDTIEYTGFPSSSDGKASACNVGDLGSILGLGRSPGEGNDNPLQYSCVENSMDGGAW